MIGRPFLRHPANVPAPVDQVDPVKENLLPEGKLVGEGRDLVVELVVGLQQDRTLKTVLKPLHRILKK